MKLLGITSFDVMITNLEKVLHMWFIHLFGFPISISKDIITATGYQRLITVCLLRGTVMTVHHENMSV